MQNQNLFSSISRRRFLQTTASGIAVVGSGALFNVSEAAKTATSSAPEPTVKHLFDSLTEEQRSSVAFDWDYRKKGRGLLRTHVNNNWNITSPEINSKFFTADQQEMVRSIFEGIINPDWHKRYYKQIEDDNGGFGDNQSIAIFGTPGDGKFEFVMTGRHLTLRCDGNSAEHVAFGGPIFYGHTGTGEFNEKADHEGNVFWEQALEANRVYEMLDGKQRVAAEIKRTPTEGDMAFRGSGKRIPGLPVTEMSDDQKVALQKVLQKLIEPFRQSDQDEVIACLKKQGGLDACSLAFYTDNDIGKDKVWDNWRLEGPSFVWHFRGAPHVHVWVNVAESADVATNSPFLLRNRS
ncbi:MAG: DUF3500 domain-containing protein [Planctomycetaceae bacterium]|nr:DUF3500 domain-containing protein [Planctomycetaceae bacterium]